MSRGGDVLGKGWENDEWNDDFVATLENMLQKAEEASAARHEGSQSAPTPNSRSSSPFIPADDGEGTSSFSESFWASGPSHDGTATSLAPSAMEALPGTVFRRGTAQQHGRLHYGRTPSFSMPSRFRQETPRAQAQAQAQARAQAQPSNISLPGDAGGQGGKYDGMMTAKDRTISDLRGRVQEVGVIRRSSNSITSMKELVSRMLLHSSLLISSSSSWSECQHSSCLSGQSSLVDMIFEITVGVDVRSAICFHSALPSKDHEIMEALRSRVEKEEQLKNALAETNALREELERLKKSRQSGGELKKRARDEEMRDLPEKSIETRVTTSALPPRSRADVAQHGHDPWAPPWMPEGSAEGAQGKTVTGLRDTSEKSAAERPRPPQGNYNDESLGIDTLRLRADNTGCEPGGESLRNDKAHDNNTPRGDSTRAAAGASSSARADAAGGSHAANGKIDDEQSRRKEMYYALQQVWGLTGIKNDGPSFLSKLYASCRQDLYTLLSSRESQGEGSVPVKPQSGRDTEGHSGSGELSEALHSALAQVANGLAPIDSLLAPLLKFLNHQDNDNIMESALRVLHCVLQHDSACRQKLLVRKRAGEPKKGDAPMATDDTSEKPESSGVGWFIKRVPSGKDDGQMNRVVVFSSPRIRCHPVQLGSGGAVPADGEGSRREKQQHKHSEDRLDHHSVPGPNPRQGQDDHDEERRPGNASVAPASDEDLIPFVKLMLYLSLSSSSTPDVRYEAVSILGVLVVNTEALEERAMFGPILFQWRIHLLLKESAAVEMQLQAVRIIHHLLFCPPLFQQLCCSTADGNGDGNKATVQQQQPVRAEEKDAAGAADLEDENEKVPIAPDPNREHENIGGQKAETSNATAAAAAKEVQWQRGLTPRAGRAKLLRGLMECLKCSSGGASQAAGQGHALHRSVIRLLTFIALSGDAGVAYLVQASSATSEEDRDDAPTQGCRGDHRMKGVVGGESASDRQGSISKGSGSGLGAVGVSKGADSADIGEDGIEVGVAEEKLDESEKGQNIPQNLVGLIDTELRIEKREGWKEPSVADERDRLIHEAVTLLCHLASHAVHSAVVLGYLTSYKYIARLTINVTSALITRKPRFQRTGGAGQRHASSKASELAEQARGLKKEVLRCLAESNLLG